MLPANAPKSAHHNNHHEGFMNFMTRDEEVIPTPNQYKRHMLFATPQMMHSCSVRNPRRVKVLLAWCIRSMAETPEYTITPWVMSSGSTDAGRFPAPFTRLDGILARGVQSAIAKARQKAFKVSDLVCGFGRNGKA